jgi:hypothetical protein
MSPLMLVMRLCPEMQFVRFLQNWRRVPVKSMLQLAHNRVGRQLGELLRPWQVQ